MEILRSKLSIPQPQQTLCRERLNRLFEDLDGKKLATVIAGAGYGKTTLVSDALSFLDIKPVWYRLDEQDADFQVFVSYLYACFSNDRYLKPGLRKQDEILIKWLAFIEKRLSGHTVLVFDDFHLVQESRPIIEALEFIMDRLPPLLHLVIIGRKDIPVRRSRLRAQDLLTEIDETSLFFSDSEIRLFFENSDVLSGDRIDNIAASTGGWAAGLVLLRYALKKRHPDNATVCLEQMNPAPKLISSYFKENIFDPQPDIVKNFMMKTALLPEIDTRLCSRIFDEKDAQAILNKMVRDHLMVFPIDDSGTVFTMHHLLREFLKSRLKAHFSPDDIYRLHVDIAKAVESGDLFLALIHYIEGHAFDEAVRLIETHEMKFLIHGKINFLSQCLSKIPEQVIEKNPKLLLTQAKMLSHFGRDHRKIRDLIIRAHLLFKKLNARDEMISCLVELGSHYYYTGHVKEAKLLMEQVLEDVDPVSVTYVIAMTYLTFLSAVLGEFDNADAYHFSALEVIDQYPEYERQGSAALINTSLTHTLYFRGKFEASYRLSKKLLKTVIELSIDPCLPLVYYQLAADCHSLGDFQNGCRFAEKGIEACEKMALSDSRKAWVYLSWAQNCVGLRQPDTAKTLIEKSMALFEEPGNRWGMANARECMHHVFLLEGNVSKAHQVLNSALEIIGGCSLNVTEGLLTNSLAALLIRQKKYSRAAKMLSNIRPRLKAAEFHLFNNHLLTARALARLNRFQEAAGQLDRALTISERHDYYRFLKNEESWISRLFKEHPETFSPLYEKHNLILEPLLEKRGDVPILKISLLGAFKAVTGESEDPLPPFKSASALMLFKYLAAHRPRGFIHKDELIELLWPDQNPQKTGSRFNMAMSALRKTLEPDLLPRAASGYIERKKDTYRIYNDHRIIIDAERFAKTVSLALKTIADPAERHKLLLKAQSIYAGPFLEENRYEDWCSQKRQLIENLYIKMLEAITDHFESLNEFENAIDYIELILQIDPWCEKAFVNLMRFHAALGNPPHVKRAYRRYKKTAGKLDCPVNPDITKLYQRLV